MPHSLKDEKKIRIVIIDEEVLVRQLVYKVIHEDPQIEIVGTFSSINNIRDRLSKLEPDVVLLDITGKKINGMDTLSEIRRLFPLLPVIVLSERTEYGANRTFDALEMGAIDFVSKPEKSGIIVFSDKHFRKRILPVVRSAVKIHEIMWEKLQHKATMTNDLETEPEQVSIRQKIDIVAIGSCTGGPRALFSLIPELPENFPVPIIIAQHMPKVYTSVFAERLNGLSSVHVEEAYNGARLQPGNIWIAPGGYHIGVKRRGLDEIIWLHRGPRENTCRPSIDVLFHSVSEIYGKTVLGILLSGRGMDGVKGSKYIRSRGGQIMVQDSTSSLIWELPEIAVKMRLVNKVLSVKKLRDEMVILANENKGVTFNDYNNRHFTGTIENQGPAYRF